MDTMTGAPVPSGACEGGFACTKCEVLCDDSTAPPTPFLRRYVLDCSTGEVAGLVDTELDGTTPYAVVGDVVTCDGSVTLPVPNVPDGEIVCFDSGPSPLVRLTVYDPNTGAIVAGPFFRDIITGAAVVPTGTPIACPEVDSADVEQEILCDDGFDPPALFLRRYTYIDGAFSSSDDFELDGSTPYVLTGDPVECPVTVANFPDDNEYLVLCDFPPLFPAGGTAVQFLRRYDVDEAGTVVAVDTELDGITPYALMAGGSVATCEAGQRDFEPEVLCDLGAGGLQFLRRYRDTILGVVASDTLLDGTTAYVVIGPVASCTEVTGPGGGPVVIGDGGGSITVDGFPDDSEFVLLCDSGNSDTPFLRRYDVDSGGAVTTADTELDGTTAYVVVGPEVLCPVTQSGTVTVDGTVNVEAPDTSNGEVIRAGKVRVTGVGDSWILGTDSGGGRVKSVTFICLNDGVPGSGSGVTVTDDFGNTTDLNTGESASWSVEALDSELDTTLRVDTTDAQAVVDVLWTEVA
jgi:hypothetical protein